MLPKANQSEDKPKDPIIQEEIKVENNGIQPIGNKGAQDVPPMNPGIGNEAMNAQIVNQALNIINDQEQEQAPKQDLYYDQMEQKPLFYQDPEEEPEQEPEPKG